MPPQPVAESPPLLRIKPSYEIYYVQQGDTLASIGRRYGVPPTKILEHNPAPSTKELRPGLPLLIPLHERTGPPMPGQQERVSSPQGRFTAQVRSVSRQSLSRGKPSQPFWWPTDGELSRGYGESVRGFWEAGIGLSAPAGTEVCAAADGTVICCVEEGRSPRPGWGNVVSIRHSDKIVSWYGYLGSILVEEGQKVGKGQRIGTVGSSGAATRPELALRFFKDERPIDPLEYLP